MAWLHPGADRAVGSSQDIIQPPGQMLCDDFAPSQIFGHVLRLYHRSSRLGVVDDGVQECDAGEDVHQVSEVAKLGA